MGSLIWLFSEYRDAAQKILRLEREILKQKLTIEQLEKLQTQPIPTVDNLLKEFSDLILAEQPYPDNKVPESAYLTPSGD